MRWWNRTAWAVAIAVGLLVSACGGDAPGGARAQGVVKSVDAGARSVTIDHGDIPGLMKAMTMTFEVAPGVALEGLQPGVAIDFRVKEERGSYTVTEIRRSGP